MILENGYDDYTYISTIVKKEYLYDGEYKDVSYFVVYDKNGNIKELPVDCCIVKSLEDIK